MVYLVNLILNRAPRQVDTLIDQSSIYALIYHPPSNAPRVLLPQKLDQGTLGMSDPLQLTFDQLGTDRTS